MVSLLIWNYSEFCLVSYQWVHGKYNRISVKLNKISKRYLFMYSTFLVAGLHTRGGRMDKTLGLSAGKSEMYGRFQGCFYTKPMATRDANPSGTIHTIIKIAGPIPTTHHDVENAANISIHLTSRYCIYIYHYSASD